MNSFRDSGEKKPNRFLSLRAQESRNEGAADAEAALRGALKPYGLEAYADRRKNGDVQYGHEVFRKIFLGVKFDGDASETEIENTGATCALFAECGIGVGTGHGDALRFALNCIGAGRGSL